MTKPPLVRFAGLAAAFAAWAAGHAHAATLTIQAVQAPRQVHAGSTVHLKVIENPGDVICWLSVRYANGFKQQSTPGTPQELDWTKWSWSWTWTVPPNAAPGSARLDVRCGSTGSLTRRFSVLG